MNIVKNLSIRAKLIGSSLLTAGLASVLLFIGLSAIQDLKVVEENAGIMYDNMIVPLAITSEIAEKSQRVRINLRDMVLTDDPEQEQYFGDRVIGIGNEITDLRREFEAGILSQEMRDAYDNWMTAHQEYQVYRDQVMALAYAEDQDDEARDLLEGAAFNAAQADIAALQNIIDMKKQHAADLDTNTVNITTGFSQRLTIFFGCFMLFTFLMGIFLARHIGGPLKGLAGKAQQIAEGNYNVDMTATRGDELGQLSQALGTMLVRIRETLARSEKLADEAHRAARRADEESRAAKAQEAYLSERVETLLGYMGRFAEGDLTMRLTAERDDEIGRLYTGFNTAVANTRTLIEHVQVAAGETQQTSSTIRTETDQLAQAARQQASQSSEISVSIAQMSDTIVDLATNASRTADVAQENGAVAEQGRVVVAQTTAKMNEIANMVSQSAETVGRLGESSEAIGEIVQTIQDIADQTNLLALNAAIEAARAGDQGRGFAVVADEVRKLAERTSHATQQIGDMIRPIQHETESAVADMNRGRHEVTEGIRLASEAGDALGRIVDASQRTIELVSQMAVAAEEQSVTSEQIARSIDDMTALIQASSDSAETVAVGIDALATQARGLSDQVATFQVDGTSTQRPTLRRAA
ncbi:MAG: methyl-accepting chemotaxis protein [Bacteroidota bacterium]